MTHARADRVIVAGDHEVDPVGVAVGVDEADQKDAQALRLAPGDCTSTYRSITKIAAGVPFMFLTPPRLGPPSWSACAARQLHDDSGWSCPSVS